MRSLRLALVALALAAGLAGCGQSAPDRPTATTGRDVIADAERAFARREWVLAARLLREAIAHDPTRLSLHYSLAIAASHLDLREEAIREFQWVLARAPAGSQEAETARRWLTEAGVLAASAPPPPAAADDPAGDSSLVGRVAWTEAGESPVDVRRMQLFLVGLPGGPTKEVRYVLRTDSEGNFAFRKVVAGSYKLTNRIAGTPQWRLRVQIEPGREATLDLTPANSTRVRDDFPNES